MRVSKEKLDTFQGERRKRIIAVASKMFMEYGIGSVSIKKISDTAEIPTASIKRYFSSTSDLVALCVVYLIEEFYSEVCERYKELSGENFTAFQEVEFFIDSFIYAYQYHKDFIRFTLDFDIYVKSQQPPLATMEKYFNAMSKFLIMFSNGFAKGKADHTIRSELLKDDVFYTCFHVMLAVVQKFSYGKTQLNPQDDELAELLLLKKMILRYIVAT